MKLYLKPTCTSCRNAKSFLRERGARFDEVDLSRGLPVEELDRLIGERDYKLFLNSRNELYRERKMKEHPPSRAEALRLMAANPNLVKRPLLVKGGQIVLGFDPDEMTKLL
jgi:arsenate reductase (glutaredoxin)